MPLIEPDQLAPDFTLHSAADRPVKLSDFTGKLVVLYFYPEDDTPLCTSQACQFRDHSADLATAGAVVIGISPDDRASHAAFARKHKLGFTLLADEPISKANPEPRVCTLYGVWADKNMYGNIVRGMLRTTYLIGPDRRVIRRWDRVKTPNHAAAVLKAIREWADGASTPSPQRKRSTMPTSRRAAKSPRTGDARR